MGRVPKTKLFEGFAQSQLCWDRDNLPESLEAVFEKDQPLMVELGSGTCYFATAFAKAHPDWNVLATDLKRDRLWKGAKRAEKQKLPNIAFVNIDVAKLAQFLPEQSVDQMWLTFPDPYPKARQAKRRMNQPNFLKTYAKLLTPTGSFHLKTDDRNFFVETVANLQKQKWEFQQLSTDTHRDYTDGDVLFTTRYEQEFLDAGLPINYLKATCYT